MVRKIDVHQIKLYISKEMRNWKVPGLAIAILKEGKIVLQEGLGYRNLRNQWKVTPDTLFGIASCTKAFTTLAMGMLVDEKKLDWDKPVREYFPAFRMQDPVATERMTPRDLATHRSGLPRHDAVWYKSSATRAELFTRLAYLEPNKDFRSLFQYNNLMFMAAGCLVEQVSGMSWEKFVQTRILNPLKMEHSNFSVTDIQNSSDFALPYALKNNKIRRIPFVNIDAIGPANSINSCISDMTQWVLFHLNQGKIRNQPLISKEQLLEMHSPQMVIKGPLKNEEELNPHYGLDWIIQPYRGFNLIYHKGSQSGFSSFASFILQENLGIIILANMDSLSLPPSLHLVNAYHIYDQLLGLSKINWNRRIKKEDEWVKRDTFMKKRQFITERKKGTKPTHPLKEYTGEFENPRYGLVTVQQKKKSLVLVYNSRKFIAQHYHYNSFLLKSKDDLDRMASYSLNSQGQIDKLSISFDPTIKEIIFQRKQL